MRDAAGVGLLLLIFGLALAVVTDIVIDRSSFRPTGAEAATSLLAAGYLCAAVFVLLDDWRHLRVVAPDLPLVRGGLRAGRVALGLPTLRRGGRPLRAAARGPVPRRSRSPGSRSPRSSRPGRPWLAQRAILPRPIGRGVELARIVALAALYVAVNYYSVDKGFLEEIGRVVGAPRHRAGEHRPAAGRVGSALYPLAVLAWGLRSRDRVLIVLGHRRRRALADDHSLLHSRRATLGRARRVGCGARGRLAAAGALAESGPRCGERFGFTAAPLYDEGRRERLLPVAAALALAPAARAHAPTSRPACRQGRRLRRRRRGRHLLVISVRGV